MTVLAVLLAAIGVADLARTGGPSSARVLVPVSVSTVAAIILLEGLGFGWQALWLAPLVAVVVTIWSAVRDGPFAWLAPTVLVIAIAAALGFGQYVPRGEPMLAGWYSSLEIPALATVPLQTAALGLGVVLFQIRSANVIVRFVLNAAGSQVLAEENTLKGGRILGPLERIFVLAAALGGQYGAVAAVMAAKGIIRFPEISRGADSGTRAEYVLVGSFVSWGLALAAVPLF